MRLFRFEWEGIGNRRSSEITQKPNRLFIIETARKSNREKKANEMQPRINKTPLSCMGTWKEARPNG